jgi:hypothetical protein
MISSDSRFHVEKSGTTTPAPPVMKRTGPRPETTMTSLGPALRRNVR